MDPIAIKLNFQAIGYRMGAATLQESTPLWIGGSEVAYNYDGISYGTGMGVDPYERILQYNPTSDKLTETMVNLPIMDNREVAQLDQQSILVCGGMSPGQQVSNSTYLIDINFVSVEEGSIGNPIYFPYPSPSEELIFINNIATGLTYEIISVKGLSIKSGVYQSSGIEVMSLAPGLYYLNVTDSKGKNIPCGRFIKQ